MEQLVEEAVERVVRKVREGWVVVSGDAATALAAALCAESLASGKPCEDVDVVEVAAKHGKVVFFLLARKNPRLLELLEPPPELAGKLGDTIAIVLSSAELEGAPAVRVHFIMWLPEAPEESLRYLKEILGKAALRTLSQLRATVQAS